MYSVTKLGKGFEVHDLECEDTKEFRNTFSNNIKDFCLSNTLHGAEFIKETLKPNIKYFVPNTNINITIKLLDLNFFNNYNNVLANLN